MKGMSKFLTFGMIAVFVATFMLFYIFDSIGKLAEQCKTSAPMPVCSRLNSFTMAMLIILLIIGGFVIIICGAAYVMLSG